MIKVTECDPPAELVKFVQNNRLFLNPFETDDWRSGRVVRDKVAACPKALPDGLCLMVFEALRSRARQWVLWNPVVAHISKNTPDWNELRIYTESSRWVFPPDELANGHQAGAAVDEKLGRADRSELDFGGPKKGLSGVALTNWPVSPEIRRNRDMFVAAKHGVGMINYPDEWWHFPTVIGCGRKCPTETKPFSHRLINRH